jgi:predicted nucleotidyltransferase
MKDAHIGIGDPEFASRDSAAVFRWYRGPDSTGTQRQGACNFDLYPDPAGVVAAVFRGGERIATLTPALESSLVWILAVTTWGNPVRLPQSQFSGGDMSEIDHLAEALDGFDEIRLAIVFGSVGLGHATYSSDLDIAILCDHTMSSDLKSSLISILARATGRPVDLVDLTQAGEPLLGEILKNGTRILSRDDSAYAELLRKHLFDATDFLPYRNRILAERRRKWIGN